MADPNTQTVSATTPPVGVLAGSQDNSNPAPASVQLQPPAPPVNALDKNSGADPTQTNVHYKLSSGHIATLPQSSVPALLQQDPNAKAIAPLQDGEVLVKLSSGQSMTLPATSIPQLKQQDPGYTVIDSRASRASTQAAPPAQSFGSKVVQGAKDSMVGQTAAMVAAPPQDAKEHAVASVGGPGALIAYRASKSVVDQAENMIKAKKEDFRQAASDFGRTVNDFNKGDWRNTASDVASTTADIMGLAPTGVPGLANRARELSEGARPGGNLTTPVTKDALDLGTLALDSDLAKENIAKVGGKVADVFKPSEAKVAAPTSQIDPNSFIYREETPAPQHGKPVKVASPLDNATVNALQGGKDLSPEAVQTLKSHIGGTPGKEIEVGSNAKNTLFKAVEPVQKVLTDTGIEMNKVIANAPAFKTSTIADESSTLLKDIDALRENLPTKAEDPLNKVIDKQMEAAYPALESTDPQEVLAARRKLGTQIDWNNIVRNPESAGEAANLTQVKIYNALGNKIHAEIPKTAELDKIFQPNLELQSHLDAKLGRGVSRDPVEANAQHLSELNKGKTQLENEAHNAVVAKNRALAGLDAHDVEASVGKTGNAANPIDAALDQAVSKFNVPDSEQSALRKMLEPSVKPGRMFGTNTSWYEGLKKFDALSPQEQAARFSDPASVREVLRSEATKQLRGTVIKYGSIGAAATALGLDKAFFHLLL